jgi:hypothetical protein
VGFSQITDKDELTMKVTVDEFQAKVWDIEAIRLIVKCEDAHMVDEYDFSNSAQQNWSVTEWLRNRILPRIGDYECIVIQGNGEEPHGRTLLRNVRASYAKD